MEYFNVVELVDKATYELLGEDSLKLFDPHVLYVLDNIREHFGEPLIVNTWAQGGNIQYRGYRPVECAIGAKRSRHKLSIAFDLAFKSQEAMNRFDKLMEWASELLFIQRIEDHSATPTWRHIEISTSPVTQTIYFKP